MPPGCLRAPRAKSGGSAPRSTPGSRRSLTGGPCPTRRHGWPSGRASGAASPDSCVSLEEHIPELAGQKARAASEAQAAERALEAAQVEHRAAMDERQHRSNQRASVLDGQPADAAAVSLVEAMWQAESRAQDAAAVTGTARTQAAEARTRREEAERALHDTVADHAIRAQAFGHAWLPAASRRTKWRRPPRWARAPLQRRRRLLLNSTPPAPATQLR